MGNEIKAPLKKMTRLAYLRQFVFNKKQEEVEVTINIPHNVYSMIETGRLTKPYPYMVEKLESFFGVPWEKLAEEVTVNVDTGTLIEE